MRQVLLTQINQGLSTASLEQLAAVRHLLSSQGLPEPQPSPAPAPGQAAPARPGRRFEAVLDGDPASGPFSLHMAPLPGSGPIPFAQPQPLAGEELSLAAKVLQLLRALDPEQRLRKAPPLKVFNLFYQKRLPCSEIARICNCDRTLVYDRLAAIRAQLPWTPQQLQEVSAMVEALEDALRDSRARAIYRKGAVYGEEDHEPEAD